MPGEPIKFRCYQCGKLLGISRQKSGAVVRCPQCRTDLVVPEPEPKSENLEAGSTPSKVPPTQPFAFLPVEECPAEQSESFGSLFPKTPDVPESGQEAVKDFPEIVLERPAPPSPPSEPEFAPEPEPELHQGLPAIDHRLEPEPQTETSDSPGDAPSPSGSAWMEPGETSTSDASGSTILEPSELAPGVPEPASVAEQKEPERWSGPSYSRRDVVMPRVAVIGWSLFVILALFLAFIAGLLIGHFLWISEPSGSSSR